MNKNRGLFLYQTIKKQHYDIIDPIRKSIPVNVKQMVGKLQIALKEEILPTDVSGAIHKDGDGNITIYFDITESEVRQRFTIAHELAHFLLGHVDKNAYISDNLLLRSNKLSNTEERDANYLAAELLMPMQKIDHLLKTNSLSISELAHKMSVSDQALSVRLGIV